MKAHEAACSIKVVILICYRDRDWKSGYPCWNSAFFLFSHSPFFHLTFCHSTAGKNRTRGRYVSSAKLGDKTKRMKPDVLWASRRFHSGLWGDSVFERGPPPPPPTVQIQPMKWVFWLGTEGKEAFDTDFRVSACVIRVTFLSGVAAHQAEIMRPCFMISDKSL